MTVIIIEGPDLSGKTFAIEKIAKNLNSGFILKNTFKPKTKRDSFRLYEHYWSIIDLVEDREDFIILDRFFPSQAVYSYMRGEDEFHSKDIISLDGYACKNNFLFIYINTPLNELEHRYLQRGDEHIKINDLRKLKKRYDQFFLETRMKKTALNTLEENWLDKIVRWIQDEYS